LDFNVPFQHTTDLQLNTAETVQRCDCDELMAQVCSALNAQ